MPSGSLTADATITGHRFFADAIIVGNHWRHFRDRDHTGTQLDTTVVLSAAIGQYAAGTTIHDVLVSLNARLNAINSANTVVTSFSVNAFIGPTFRANAVIFKTATATVTADAWFAMGSSFTANSMVKRTQSGSFTAAAAIV